MGCQRDTEICVWGMFCFPCLYGQTKVRTGREPSSGAGFLQLLIVPAIVHGIANFVLNNNPSTVLDLFGVSGADNLKKFADVLVMVRTLAPLRGDVCRWLTGGSAVLPCVRVRVWGAGGYSVQSDTLAARIVRRCRGSTATEPRTFPLPA
jgi:hypothetical protein